MVVPFHSPTIPPATYEFQLLHNLPLFSVLSCFVLFNLAHSNSCVVMVMCSYLFIYVCMFSTYWKSLFTSNFVYYFFL